MIKKNKVKFPIKEENDILIENKIIPRDSYYLSKIFNEKLVQSFTDEHIKTIDIKGQEWDIAMLFQSL